MKWDFMQIEPQPARGTFDKSMWDDQEWIAEEKYDGDRRIAQFCEKIVRFTGRRKSVKDGRFVEKTENVPHLSFNWKGPITATECASRPPPKGLEGTVLDGEMVINPENLPHLHVDEGRSKFVTSIMGSLPEEAIKKQRRDGWLHYVVFDCLFWKGQDVRSLPLTQRQDYANMAVSAWSNPYAHMVEGWATKKREFYNEIIGRGGEGVVLKHVEHTYGDKNGWVKVKKQATADVVIMGFVPAKEMSKKKGDDEESITKYAKAGLIGAIQCGQYSGRVHDEYQFVEVATISGFPDDLRLEFTKNPKKFMGKVVEIKHNGREPTGRFRHPRFGRFRDDKRAKDCTYRAEES